jgi:hypothetical protein
MFSDLHLKTDGSLYNAIPVDIFFVWLVLRVYLNKFALFVWQVERHAAVETAGTHQRWSKRSPRFVAARRLYRLV